MVGTTTESWEKATAAAIRMASKSLRDLRVAEVGTLDCTIKDGKVEHYRAELKSPSSTRTSSQPSRATAGRVLPGDGRSGAAGSVVRPK